MSEDTEEYIRKFCIQYTDEKAIPFQIGDKVRSLTDATMVATEQAKINAESSARLSASMNKLQFWLVIVGAATFLALLAQTVALLAQTVVAIITLIHH